MILCLLILAGFATWSVALMRNCALDTRRAWLLAVLIFADEYLELLVLSWVANHVTQANIVAVALGGAVAGFIVIRKARK